jgi:hypothetical protein
LALLTVTRNQMSGFEGGMRNLHVVVQNVQSTPQRFIVNYVGTGRHAATNRKRSLGALQQNGEWIASLNGRTGIIDAKVRGFVRPTCL